MPIEAPIIIVGDGQVELFNSTGNVEGDVEAVDAELYRAYDSKGRPVRLIGQYTEGRFLGLGWVNSGAVSATLAGEEPTHAEELRVALVDWWTRTGGCTRRGVEPDAAKWTLDQLVEAIATRDGVKGRR